MSWLGPLITSITSLRGARGICAALATILLIPICGLGGADFPKPIEHPLLLSSTNAAWSPFGRIEDRISRQLLSLAKRPTSVISDSLQEGGNNELEEVAFGRVAAERYRIRRFDLAFDGVAAFLLQPSWWLRPPLSLVLAFVALETLLAVFLVVATITSGRARRSLRSRLILKRIVSDFSAQLNISSGSFDLEIRRCLERILAAVGADRISWYVKRQSSTEMVRVYSASTSEMPEAPREIKFEEMPYVIATLMRGDPLILGRLQDLPRSAMADRLTLKTLDIKSLALFPSNCAMSEKGVLSLSSRFTQRKWTEETSSLLGILSNVIGAAVDRVNMEKARQETESRFRALFEQASVGVVLETTSGKLLLVNPAFCSLLDYTSEEMLHLSCAQLTHPDDAEKETLLFEELKGGLRSNYQIEKRFVRKDGSVIWGHVSVSLLKTSDGAPLVVGMLKDITERKEADRRMLASWTLVHSTLDALPAQIAILDNVGRIIAVNAAWRELADSEGMKCPLHGLGTNFFNICAAATGDDAKTAFATGEMVRSLLRGDLFTGELLQTSRTSRGDEVWYQIGLARFEESGSPRVVLSYRDVTELIRTREELAQNRERLSLALEASHAGTWDWNLLEGEIYWTANGNGEALQHGCVPAGNYEALLERVYAEDRPNLKSALEEALTGRNPFSCEFRVRGPDGPLRWILGKGKTYCSKGKKIVRMQGVYIDVTDLRQRDIDLHNLAGRLIQAQEDERKRISRELHDDVGQRISLMGVELDLLAHNLPETSEEVQSNLLSLLHQAEDIASDIHQLSHGLHSAKLQHLGLKAALKDLCRHISSQRDIEIDFNVTALSQAVPPDIALCLFRVTQEALNNAVKHSKSKRVLVEIEEDRGIVRLRIKDFGVGFDYSTLSSQGVGLASMRERLRIVYGTFAVKTRLGEGTELTAEVPLTRLALTRQAGQVSG